MPSDLSWFSSVHFLTLFSQCLGCALLSAPFCRQISALLRLRSYVGALLSGALLTGCRRKSMPSKLIFRLELTLARTVLTQPKIDMADLVSIDKSHILCCRIVT